MKNKPEAATQPSTSDMKSFDLPPKHTFTVVKLAEYLGVNHKTVRDQIAAGTIKAIRLGRTIRIPRSEVLRLLGR